MKQFFILLMIFFNSLATADEIKVINNSNEMQKGQEVFFLIGTTEGSYSVKSWQFDIEKATWNGEGEPNLPIGKAIDQTYKYFKKSKTKYGVKSTEFNPAFSKKGTIIWYYLVTLTTLPYKFGAETLEIVVLSSGELLKAKGK